MLERARRGAGAASALVLLAVRSDRVERRGAGRRRRWPSAGSLLNLLLVAGGIDDLITRNVIALWLPAACVVAAAASARDARAVGVAGGGALCATA